MSPFFYKTFQGALQPLKKSMCWTLNVSIFLAPRASIEVLACARKFEIKAISLIWTMPACFFSKIAPLTRKYLATWIGNISKKTYHLDFCLHNVTEYATLSKMRQSHLKAF